MEKDKRSGLFIGLFIVALVDEIAPSFDPIPRYRDDIKGVSRLVTFRQNFV